MKKALLSIALTVLLSSCSTPTAVMDEAKLSVQMMGDLRGQLEKFKEEMKKVDEPRNTVLALQAARITEREATLDAYSSDTVAPVMKPEADTYFRLRKAAQVKAAAVEKANAPVEPTILESLPDFVTPLNAAQTALGPLASELGPSDRLQTARQFIDDIRKGVKLNEQKIEDAKKGAPGSAPTGEAAK